MNAVSASKLDHQNIYSPETTTRQILSLHKLPYTYEAFLLINIQQ